MEIVKVIIKNDVLNIFFEKYGILRDLNFLHEGNGQYRLISSSIHENIPYYANTLIECVFKGKEKVKLIANGFQLPAELIIAKHVFGE